MKEKMYELIKEIRDAEINYIEKSHEVVLAELDLKIVESSLHSKTDFKELGLTNQKQRDAYVLEKMATDKANMLELQSVLKTMQAEIGAFKREFELNKALLMSREE
jgi:hypothetical protein